MDILGVDVRVAKIDGPKGYDPAGLDPNEGDSVENDPAGSTFDGSAAGMGSASDLLDDAEDMISGAGVFGDASRAEVKDSGVDEF